MSSFKSSVDLSLSENGRHALDALQTSTTIQQLEDRCHELETRLAAVQERFMLMQKATRDAIWDWDLIHNVGWYSEGLRTLYGYDPNEIGDGVSFWYKNIHPDDEMRVTQGIHNVIDTGGKNWSDRYRFRKADGSYCWILDRGYAIHDSVGKPIRMVGSMQDITKEIEASEALRESEEKFKAAFSQAAVGICIATPQGQWISFNEVYPKIFGYTDDELRTKSFVDITHPDEREADRESLQDLMSGKISVIEREKRYVHKSGKVIWGRVSASLINGQDGKPKYMVGVLQDVTELKKMLESLKENEERYRLALDSAKLGTFDFHPLTGHLVWDDRCKELFGLAPDDHVDYDVFLNGLHPDDREFTDQANRAAMSGQGNGEYDIEYRTVGIRDKKLRWLRAKGRGYNSADGICYRYAGTVIDITEQKEREHKLIEQERRFRTLATMIPQIVWTTDEHGLVDFITDKWEDYTGQPPTYSRFSFREMMHEEDLFRMTPEWNKSFLAGEPFQTEYRLKNIRTGNYRWYSSTIAPLRDERGNVTRWVGSATDIHDQKMVEQSLEDRVEQRTKELSALNNRLERSNAELEQYAYVTSHDLKEPLRKVQFFSNLLTQKFSNSISSEVNQYLNRIASSAERMTSLINDLLAYSKLSETDNAFERVDLNKTVRDVQTDFELLLNEKNIAVILEPLPTIFAVRLHMQQLFANLIGNAIKFSKPGIPNRIVFASSILPASEKENFPELSKDLTHYKITITDEGVGFNEQYSEKIFSIFHRLNHRSEVDGHGIGLALCRKIVTSHHGIIFASGTEGMGATFTIILPQERVESRHL